MILKLQHRHFLCAKRQRNKGKNDYRKVFTRFQSLRTYLCSYYTDNEKLKSLMADGCNIGVEIPRGL